MVQATYKYSQAKSGTAKGIGPFEVVHYGMPGSFEEERQPFVGHI